MNTIFYRTLPVDASVETIEIKGNIGRHSGKTWKIGKKFGKFEKSGKNWKIQKTFGS